MRTGVKKLSKLEIYRRKKGLSARALAQLAGVNSTVISQVETGWVKPYPKLRREISKALGVSEEVLFGDGKIILEV